MTPEFFWDLVGRVGPWAALCGLALWASMTGRFRWSREFEQSTRDIAELKADYAKREAEWRAERDQLRTERDYWQDRAWSTMEHWTGDLEVGRKLTRDAAPGIAGRVIGRERR